MDKENFSIEEVKFDKTQLKLLIKLAMYKELDSGEDLSPTKLSIIMDLTTLSPYFRKVCNSLRNLSILYVSRELAKNQKLYRIDYNKLRDLIDDQDETEVWFEYFNYFHICDW